MLCLGTSPQVVREQACLCPPSEGSEQGEVPGRGPHSWGRAYRVHRFVYTDPDPISQARHSSSYALWSHPTFYLHPLPSPTVRQHSASHPSWNARLPQALDLCSFLSSAWDSSPPPNSTWQTCSHPSVSNLIIGSSVTPPSGSPGRRSPAPLCDVRHHVNTPLLQQVPHIMGSLIHTLLLALNFELLTNRIYLMHLCYTPLYMA